MAAAVTTEDLNADADFTIQHFDPTTIAFKEARILISGQSGSGKSVLLVHLMKVMRHMFDLVIGFCPSEAGSGTLKAFCTPLFSFDTFEPERIGKILQFQKTLQTQGVKPLRVLVVMDDCMGDKTAWNSPHVRDLLMQGRHLQVASIILVQYMMDIPRPIRQQIRYFFGFNEDAPKNVENIHDFFFSCVDDKKDFKAIFRQCTVGYQCIVKDFSTKGNTPENVIKYFLATPTKGVIRVGRSVFRRMGEALKRDTRVGGPTLAQLAGLEPTTEPAAGGGGAAGGAQSKKPKKGPLVQLAKSSAPAAGAAGAAAKPKGASKRKAAKPKGASKRKAVLGASGASGTSRAWGRFQQQHQQHQHQQQVITIGAPVPRR